MSAQEILHHVIIPASLEGERLDRALSVLLPDYSRSLLTKWIKAGNVSHNAIPLTTPKKPVETGWEIKLCTEIQTIAKDTPQDIPLDILYEDDALILLNKPVGLIVHPGAGNPDQTLVNALLFHAPALAQLPRAGLIHRLDKDTSGILICAKTLESYHALGSAMRARAIKREYVALVRGHLISGGTVDEPIGRHPTKRICMAVNPRGKPAVTHYRIAEHLGPHTLLNCQLETGRTHQIRVHLTHIDHPLVGDQVYGGKHAMMKKSLSPEQQTAIQGFKRQALHARRLTLMHPDSGETLSVEAPIPEDMLNLIEELRKKE